MRLIGLGGARDPVQADHDAIQPSALDDLVGNAGLEVLELRPGIQTRIANECIAVGLLATVFPAVQTFNAGRLTALDSGVRCAGDRVIDTQTEFFTLLL
ncbi:hypothetical protein D3C75_1108490 [compost metagenome]